MIDLVYIASPSFSGSTLLTFLLGAHPAVATMGELKWANLDLATYCCSCGALLRECEFWRQVAGRMRARGLPFALARPRTAFRCPGRPLIDRLARTRVRGPAFEWSRDALLGILPAARRELRLARTVNRALIEIILALQGGRFFVDASKDPVRLKFLRRTGDYDIRVIHLLRDGRVVTNSFLKNKGLRVQTSALEWRRTHEQLERLRPRFGPDRWLRLHYEALCADPQARLAELFAFLRLPPIDVLARYRVAEHHILGNKMRLRAENRIALDEQWRSTLTPAHLADFDRLAGACNGRYGYG